MAGNKTAGQGAEPVEITPRDIQFECPSCGKSLVVDQAAEGLIVDCPQCHSNVIVPPKPERGATPPTTPVVGTAVLDTAPPSALPALHQRLNALANQLKELQTQRTEFGTRLAGRINDINRDLVLVARLETSHQQILDEWKQLAAELGALGQGATASVAAPPVVATSVGNTSSGRTRVQFGR